MANNFSKIISFESLITPTIVKILFWIVVFVIVASSVAMMSDGNIGQGMSLLIVGPIIARIYAELVLVIFKINDGIQDIAKK